MTERPAIKGLLLCPVHSDCAEAEKQLQSRGLDAVAYRGRFTTGDDANCWNAQADVAESMGFSVTAAVCPNCLNRDRCMRVGYLSTLDAARNADVAIATHSRAAHKDIQDLASGRQYVSVQEDPIAVLRPMAEASEGDIAAADTVIDRLLCDPMFLNWLGDAVRRDEDGNEYFDAKLAARKDRLYEFAFHLTDLIADLLTAMRTADKTQEWKPKAVLEKAPGIERLLYRATTIAQASFSGSPWRVILGCAIGSVESAGIIVDTRLEKGGRKVSSRRLVGVWTNIPSVHTATVWFSDATADLSTLEFVLGQRVHDGTPRGRLPMRHKAVQVAKDVTRRTTQKIVQNVLRGILADRPEFTRVGVIGHSCHRKAIEKLGPPFGDRIAKVSYFGSGLDRSSNDWHRDCDLLVILGTPRVPPGEIRSYLWRVGQIGAACRDPEWKPYQWLGKTEAGEEVQVKALGYPDDPEWRRAHRNLVRANLIQAAGRARGILAEGIEVLVVTTEECGLPLSDRESETVGNTGASILRAMSELTLANPKEYYLGKASVSTAQLAIALGLSLPRVRSVLADLERRGIVAKVGERSGWRLVNPPHRESSQ